MKKIYVLFVAVAALVLNTANAYEKDQYEDNADAESVYEYSSYEYATPSPTKAKLTKAPTKKPTLKPTRKPTIRPTKPTKRPTNHPTAKPTRRCPKLRKCPKITCTESPTFPNVTMNSTY
jgi:hypothetical protein